MKTEDHGRALELLLRTSADLPADRQLVYPPTWFLVAAATAAVVTLLLSFGARTAFGSAKARRVFDGKSNTITFPAEEYPSFPDLGRLGVYAGIVRVRSPSLEVKTANGVIDDFASPTVVADGPLGRGALAEPGR